MAIERVRKNAASPPVPPVTSIQCDATAPDSIHILFPSAVDANSIGEARDPNNYKVTLFTGPGAAVPSRSLSGIATVQLDQNKTNAFIALDKGAPNPLTLTGGQWI